MIDFIVFLFFTFSGLIPVDNSTLDVFPNGTIVGDPFKENRKDMNMYLLCVGTAALYPGIYEPPLSCHSF